MIAKRQDMTAQDANAFVKDKLLDLTALK